MGNTAIQLPGLSFRCRDLDFECDFEVRGVTTENEMMGIIAKHAKRCHGFQEITPEIVISASASVRRQ